MTVSDVFEGIRLAKERRIAKAKEKELQGAQGLISSYADNLVSLFKTEQFVQSARGKRQCIIHFNPYPDTEVMKKAMGNISKKEYLAEFEKILAMKLEQQGFSNFALSSSILNSKKPIVLMVKW